MHKDWEHTDPNQCNNICLEVNICQEKENNNKNPQLLRILGFPLKKELFALKFQINFYFPRVKVRPSVPLTKATPEGGEAESALGSSGRVQAGHLTSQLGDTWQTPGAMSFRLRVHCRAPISGILFAFLFHPQQTPSLSILTSFSGYCSQDVTARSMYRIGDRKGCTAEPRGLHG